MIHLNVKKLNTKTKSIHEVRYVVASAGDFDGNSTSAIASIPSTLQCVSMEGAKMLEEYGGISGQIVTLLFLANFSN